MISCSLLINYVNTTHFFVVHFDNIWAKYLDFWQWSFLPAGNCRCCCHSFNITEKQCYWTPVKPLTASYLIRIQVLEITSHRLSVNRHLRYSFPILSGSANTIQTSLIKLYYKWGTVEENIKKNTVTTSVIFKTAPGPRFSSALFLPMCKCNW